MIKPVHIASVAMAALLVSGCDDKVGSSTAKHEGKQSVESSTESGVTTGNSQKIEAQSQRVIRRPAALTVLPVLVELSPASDVPTTKALAAGADMAACRTAFQRAQKPDPWSAGEQATGARCLAGWLRVLIARPQQVWPLDGWGTPAQHRWAARATAAAVAVGDWSADVGGHTASGIFSDSDQVAGKVRALALASAPRHVHQLADLVAELGQAAPPTLDFTGRCGQAWLMTVRGIQYNLCGAPGGFAIEAAGLPFLGGSAGALGGQQIEISLADSTTIDGESGVNTAQKTVGSSSSTGTAETAVQH